MTLHQSARTFALAAAVGLGAIAGQQAGAAQMALAGFMVEVVNPAANTLFGARGKASLSDKDWDDVRRATSALSGASATIASGGAAPADRARAGGAAWRDWSQKFATAAQAARQAGERRDRQALIAASSSLVDACEGCHTAVAMTGR